MSRVRNRDEPDRFGFDENRSYISEALGKILPNALARRALTVTVETDSTAYRRDEPVTVVVTFKNRLPVPVNVPTARQRLWGWAVDGELEASDERLHTREIPSSFHFRGGERKRVEFVWDGRFQRTRDDGLREWVTADPGEYEISAFVATAPGTHRPRDSATVTIR